MKKITNADIKSAEQISDRLIKNKLFQVPVIPEEEPEAKYAEIDGYWKDDETAFTGYIVALRPSTEREQEGKDGDENVFYYFDNQEELEAEFLLAHQTNLDFVITGYKLFEE
jgi:hypothetical protein